MKPLAPVTRTAPPAGRRRAPGSGAAALDLRGPRARGVSVAVAMSRTDPSSSTPSAWQSASTASSAVEEAVDLGLGERQRRQQLDHVVLAGRHRDDAVVAVQRDHDELREQPLAGEVDQAPVERARRALGAPSSMPIISPQPRTSCDHLVALRSSLEPVGEAARPCARRARRGRRARSRAASRARRPSTGGCARRSTGARRSARACRRPAGRSRGVVTIAATGM